jgi:hypothetical protein
VYHVADDALALFLVGFMRAVVSFCFLLIFVISSSDMGSAESIEGDPNLARMVSCMTGYFGSSEQAAADDAYTDIRLEMWPIWTDREDGHWLYVEQTVAGREHAPYRQRVYRVTAEEGGTFRSEVYTLPGPKRFVGAWASEESFAILPRDSLTLRDGCGILLRKSAEGGFEGSTQERYCSSELGGTSYATSEVRIDERGLSSWDREYDADGEQAWGAENGPYLFRRR